MYTEVKITTQVAEPWHEILTAYLGEDGAESFSSEGNTLSVFFSTEVLPNGIEETIKQHIPQEFLTNIEQVEHADQNWNATWESSFSPITINKDLLIKAPFHNDNEGDYAMTVTILPKMSFGTGHHETTYLMSEQLLQTDVKGLDILDMGTGTGILGILALKLGAKHVVGIDIEDWAYENTKENLELNNTEGFDVILGGKEVIPNKKFELILANINKNILKDQLGLYKEHLLPNGEIWLSGFFKQDVDELVELGKKLGLREKQRFEKNDWALLQLH